MIVFRSKCCFKCGETKPIKQFYKHKKMKDGHLNKCIECTRLDVSKYRRNNTEKIREKDKERNKTPKRKKTMRVYSLEYRQKYPARYHANIKLNNAVRDGMINKINACELCRKSGKTIAHHEDYSEPLKVIWICQACHKQLHNEKALLLNIF